MLEERESAMEAKAALESGETTINAVRKRFGLSALKSSIADQQLKKPD